MRAVFADTYYFLALLIPDDGAHEAALAAARNLSAQAVTTAWVLTEVADAMADLDNREECARLILALRSSPKFVIIPPTADRFEAGFELYRSRPDKDWSLTDCISFVVMKERGITEALTGDHHFEQAGFAALLKRK